MFDVMAISLKRCAEDTDCDRAKRESDKLAGLARILADVIERFSADNPPERSQE